MYNVKSAYSSFQYAHEVACLYVKKYDWSKMRNFRVYRPILIRDITDWNLAAPDYLRISTIIPLYRVYTKL